MKRTLLLGSAWTASAAAAVGLGFLAISLVDASASDTGPVTPAAATSDASAATSTTGPAAVTAGQQVTDGGTVYGSCDEGGVPLVASAPAAGWWLDDSSDGGKVEFQNGVLEVEVSVYCTAGSAYFVVEGPQSDDSGPSSAPSATTSSPAAPASSAGDDSDGRVGGGHGQDDGPGDDSSGRSGGGHGSDD